MIKLTSFGLMTFVRVKNLGRSQDISKQIWKIESVPYRFQIRDLEGNHKTITKAGKMCKCIPINSCHAIKTNHQSKKRHRDWHENCLTECQDCAFFVPLLKQVFREGSPQMRISTSFSQKESWSWGRKEFSWPEGNAGKNVDGESIVEMPFFSLWTERENNG